MHTLTTRRILSASAIAPLAIAVPVFVLGLGMWAGSAMVVANPALNRLSALQFGAINAAIVYVALLLICLLVALLLRRFKALRRQVLLGIAGLGSLIAGAWLGCSWEAACSSYGGVINLVIQGGIAFSLSAVLIATWWWLATRKTVRAPASSVA